MISSKIYNPKYYDGVNLKQIRPSVSAFRTYKMKDGALIGLFQGNRGINPELDFVIKLLMPGADKKLRPPTHTFWVVDLLLKIPQYKSEVKEIVDYYIDYYGRTKPFSSVEERNYYELETVQTITLKYSHLEQPYTLSLDYVATVVELFCKNEKRMPGAYMFKALLTALKDYIDGKLDYTQVLKAAEPGYR
jgi:hypothetical protein